MNSDSELFTVITTPSIKKINYYQQHIFMVLTSNNIKNEKDEISTPSLSLCVWDGALTPETGELNSGPGSGAETSGDRSQQRDTPSQQSTN